MTPARRRTAATVAGVLVALLALTGCGGSSDKVSLSGTVVDPPYDVSAVALASTAGGTFTMTEDTTKELTLVFFGYTQCPDICPGVLSSIASALTRLTAEQRAQVELVFVSTDPKRDTPAVLEDYLGRFDPSFVGLSGTIEQVSAVAEPLHIFVDDGEQLPGGGYDPNSHGTQVFGVNADHEAQIFWGAETSPAEFADDFRFLLDEKPERLQGPNG